MWVDVIGGQGYEVVLVLRHGQELGRNWSKKGWLFVTEFCALWCAGSGTDRKLALSAGKMWLQQKETDVEDLTGALLDTPKTSATCQTLNGLVQVCGSTLRHQPLKSMRTLRCAETLCCAGLKCCAETLRCTAM
jgi:hypothetical protein